MVVEADESDRSFLLLAPVVAVVTTIDREHLDHYASLEEIQDAFMQFVNRVPFYGAAVLCLDEPNVQAILPRVTRPIITYGTSSQADLVISDVELHRSRPANFRLTYRGEDLGMFHLPGPPGIHNVRNAAAAAAVALYLERSRRSDPRGPRAISLAWAAASKSRAVVDGVTLIDDYGHHPAEIRATLEAARGCDYNRLLVLFQPHRYIAHPASLGRFLPAFNQADMLVLTDIYPPAKRRLPASRRGPGRQHSRRRPQERHLLRYYAGRRSNFLLREARPGDAVLAIGAGNVNRALGEFAVLLGARIPDDRRRTDAH